MSRIAKNPISVPKGTEVNLSGASVSIKGPKGQMSMDLHDIVEMNQDGDVLTFKPRGDAKSAWAMTGTMRSLVNNMVNGVSAGFEKKLTLVGVGYRAQALFLQPLEKACQAFGRVTGLVEHCHTPVVGLRLHVAAVG